MEKIGPNQLALDCGETGVAGKGAFHLFCAGFELGQQVAMPALEIFQNLPQLRRCVFRAQGQNAVNDMVGPGLVGGIQVARFRCRLEGPYDDPGRVRTKVECLPVQELDL